jgi:putative nucleotidyltransferase with HDIG domain
LNVSYDFSQLPPPVQKAVHLLDQAGERAWLVGGATRDLLSGKSVKDFDFVMAGNGLKWARRLANALQGAYVALDDERAVGRVVFSHKGKQLWIDVARFRAEGVLQGESTSLEEDLALRDFTVNAIALEPLTGQLVDPTGGVADLKANLLRATGPRTFQDDPLRILRAIRLHATHSLTLTAETWQLMQGATNGLSRISAERVREEWMKLLAPVGAKARIEMLDQLGVLQILLPELTLCKGVTQSPPHSEDVFAHQLLVLEATEQLWPWQLPNQFWQGKLAPFIEPMSQHLQQEISHELPRWLLFKHVALLHDIGKPSTRSIGKDGRIHYYKHEVVGTDMIREVMQRMKFSTKSVQYAEIMVRQHLRVLHLSAQLPPRSRSVYRFFRDTKAIGPDIALHSIADQRGKAFPVDRKEVVIAVTRLLEAYFTQEERFVRPKPLLNGHQVMAIAQVKGPPVGQILEQLREEQAQGRIQSPQEAEQFVRQWSKD